MKKFMKIFKVVFLLCYIHDFLVVFLFTHDIDVKIRELSCIKDWKFGKHKKMLWTRRVVNLTSLLTYTLWTFEIIIFFTLANYIPFRTNKSNL